MPRRASDDRWGLRGSVVVVTGATRGNGRAIAEALASVGASVVVTSRKAADAERAAAELRKAHKVATLGVGADVTKKEQVRHLFDQVEGWSKAPLAAVVNNAGYEIVKEWWETPLHEFSPEELEAAVRTVAAADLDGSRWCAYYALPRLLRQRSGSLVFTSSTPALTGYKGFPYTEAKAAVLGLMRDLARTYGPYGIRANAIAPGNIRTGWLDHIPAEERKRLETENALQRFGEPGEIAEVVLFLASKMSSFITGETLVVDGGTFMR
ncbi:MAG TPA: SDR family NAD(P)-dependent oxidoreductase [Candidatus Thermoplasmatota archaeon]|nr:SDR family NAD(P)-dependent oxidoreductase [Candidatus Thermoplasmatota archaeon]